MGFLIYFLRQLASVLHMKHTWDDILVNDFNSLSHNNNYYNLENKFFRKGISKIELFCKLSPPHLFFDSNLCHITQLKILTNQQGNQSKIL